MRLETAAFVLRTHPLGEADRIVTLFSRDHGKLRGIAAHAAASRRRFGGALSVLSEVEVRFSTRPGRDLGRLESCELIRPTPGEGRDIEAYYASAYLAEVLEEFGREGEEDERLYRLARVCARALAEHLDPYRVCRYFEIWVLKLAGLLPDLGPCRACGRALALIGAAATPQGEVTCRQCAPGASPSVRLLSADAVCLIRRFLGESPLEAAAKESRLADLRGIATFTAGQFLLLAERPFRAAATVVPRRVSQQRSTVEKST